MHDETKKTIYEGVCQGVRGVYLTAGESVFVDGQRLPLAPSLKVFKHSPDGFNWGYSGSGPAQLALAILLDYFGNVEKAVQLYQSFKNRVIAGLPQGQGWTLTGERIEQVCEEIENPNQKATG